MDKQKQIEEIRDLLYGFWNSNIVIGDEYKVVAEALVNNLRKEAAEKFAEMAKEGAFVDFMGEPIIRASKIDEICKEITGGECYGRSKQND